MLTWAARHTQKKACRLFQTEETGRSQLSDLHTNLRPREPEELFYTGKTILHFLSNAKNINMNQTLPKPILKYRTDWGVWVGGWKALRVYPDRLCQPGTPREKANPRSYSTLAKKTLLAFPFNFTLGKLYFLYTKIILPWWMGPKLSVPWCRESLHPPGGYAQRNQSWIWLVQTKPGLTH